MWSDISDDFPSGVDLPLPLVATPEEVLLARSFAPLTDDMVGVVLFAATAAFAQEMDPLVEAATLELGPFPLEDPVAGGDEEDVLLLFDGIREF